MMLLPGASSRRSLFLFHPHGVPPPETPVFSLMLHTGKKPGYQNGFGAWRGAFPPHTPPRCPSPFFLPGQVLGFALENSDLCFPAYRTGGALSHRRFCKPSRTRGARSPFPSAHIQPSDTPAPDSNFPGSASYHWLPQENYCPTGFMPWAHGLDWNDERLKDYNKHRPTSFHQGR